MEIANSLIADVFVPHSKVSDACNSFLSQERAKDALNKYQQGIWVHPGNVPAHPSGGPAHADDMEHALFLNEKLVITNTSATDTSRGSTPSDVHASSHYAESSGSSAAIQKWAGGIDAQVHVSSSMSAPYHQSVYGTHSHSPASLDGLHEPSTYTHAPVMDWTTSPSSHVKVESPPLHPHVIYNDSQSYSGSPTVQ
ncbi:10529_t:CDS:2, partial [Acaulospora colombiana]